MYMIPVVLIIGYVMIAFEQKLKIDKAATALITGGLCWVLYVFSGGTVVDSPEFIHHVYDIAEIVLFLLAAMAIVEIIDVHEGFAVITERITTRNKDKLLVIIAITTFFLSALLDNLTTSIVMASLLSKIIKHDKQTRWMYAGVVIIVANAGGIFSPIGNVTSIMLYVGGQLTAVPMITSLFIPSVVAAAVPVFWFMHKFKGSLDHPSPSDFSVAETDYRTTRKEKTFVLIFGVFCLLFTPVFHVFTELPPFLGMLMSLGFLWTATEILHWRKGDDLRTHFGVKSALKQVDTTSMLFFVGTLFAVAAVGEAGYLAHLATGLQDLLGNVYEIDLVIGFASAVVANVPLVAAVMKMYPIADPATADVWQQMFVQDGHFWRFLAYCSGAGGSTLILGSAAGVAVMGIEKMDFMWYLKHMTLVAIAGYLAGAAVYVGMAYIFG